MLYLTVYRFLYLQFFLRALEFTDLFYAKSNLCNLLYRIQHTAFVSGVDLSNIIETSIDYCTHLSNQTTLL
jgi:hypothetical protein